ncbi:hypothetical protein D4Q52_21760 [Rhodopseudomonas palustris]|uniref:Uncharacterized protein n=1 Tax=Rhodopseudomonas palustris TaxID=1076 RepID=A0A418UZE1_RHOPL|nr:hypothetical protein D4Q52_21760 [Rhodopseudomonas palustris]
MRAVSSPFAWLQPGRFVSANELSTRHGRACPGHPRLCCLSRRKAWMPGTSPGMTWGDTAN